MQGIASGRLHQAALISVFILLAAHAVGADDAQCGPTQSEAGTTPKVASTESEKLQRANALAASGDHSSALAAYDALGDEGRSSSDPILGPTASASAARSEALLGHAERSQIRVAEALRGAEGLGAAQRARLHLHVARTLVILGEDARAAQMLIGATEEARAASEWRIHSFALGNLGEIYEGRGRSDDAIQVVRRALFSAERVNAQGAMIRWNALLGKIHRQQGDFEAAIAAYRTAVLLIRGVPDFDHAQGAPIFDEFVDLLLERFEKSNSKDGQILLAEVRDTLEDRNVSALVDYFRDPCLDARRKAASDTIPGTLVIYPVPLADRLVLISSVGGRLDRHVVEVSREELDEQVQLMRAYIEDRMTRVYLRPARRLYGWLIRPIEGLLTEDIETLVFVPRGSLNTIPLSALNDEATGKFLIERIALAITPSLTLTDPHPIDRSSVQLLAAGISESVQGFSELGFVEREIGEVSDLLPGQHLLNERFIADRFENSLEERPFGIVHVASHGKFADESGESFLLTYDGRISMDRLAGLVGSTRFRTGGLELLTLSACETAIGDERAALGLAGVALQAGAQSALATLWAINDQVSADLMIEFYRELSKTKTSRAEALRTAQLSVLAQREYRHPAYWAPYILVSNWL